MGAILLNAWKWNLVEAEDRWKKGDRIGSRRHSMNALNIERAINLL